MTLIDELKAPEPDPALATELTRLAQAIIHQIDGGEDCSNLLQEICRLTRRNYFDEFYFKSLYGWSSPEEFGALASFGPATPILNISKAQVVALIELASEIDIKNSSYYLGIMEESLPFSQVTDLIYYPDQDRSNEEMAEEALIRDKLGSVHGQDLVDERLRGQAEAVLADPNAKIWSVQWANSILTGA